VSELHLIPSLSKSVVIRGAKLIEERNAQASRSPRTKGDLANELRELAQRHGLSYGRAAEIMSQLDNGAAHPGAD